MILKKINLMKNIRTIQLAVFCEASADHLIKSYVRTYNLPVISIVATIRYINFQKNYSKIIKILSKPIPIYAESKLKDGFT